MKTRRYSGCSTLFAPHTALSRRAMSEHLIGMGRKIRQQVEFFRRETYFAITHQHLAGTQNRFEIADLNARLLLVLGLQGGSSQACPHACQEFVHAEWLRYIIVGAGIEGLDLRLLLAREPTAR